LSLARSRHQFDIVLKDGTELTAILLAISEDRDLALLELNGDYHTPFIRLDLSQTLSQGMPVFAIGDPLGMQDTVTAGVVAQITPNDLLTDAQVLPGSSGGPLIRESGEVIGINVSRKVAAGTSKYAAGFGKAIPIALAVQAFPSLSTLVETRDVAEATIGLPGANPVRQLSTRPLGTEMGPSRQEGYSSRSANLARGHIGSFDSVPARLILPNENAARDLGEPAQSDPHSLDFPPEGGGTVFSGRK
jgi:S1-C subfamily serine protease